MSQGRHKELTLQGLTFGEVGVAVPRTADITPVFYQGEEYMWLLQDALDVLFEDWQEAGDTKQGQHHMWPDRNHGPSLTLELDEEDPVLYPNVVQVSSDEKRLWAIHADHAARRAQPSPFVRRCRADQPKPGMLAIGPVRSLTIELAGTAERPALVRAYPGEYQPPLPWMASAKNAEGGVAESRQYWLSHAYVADPAAMAGKVWAASPVWFRDFEHYLYNQAQRARRQRRRQR